MARSTEDLAIDIPSATKPTITVAGPSFAPNELATRKILALFGRAEPRDFIDVYVLHQRLDCSETLLAAAEADPGFDRAMFTETLRSHAHRRSGLYEHRRFHHCHSEILRYVGRITRGTPIASRLDA